MYVCRVNPRPLKLTLFKVIEHTGTSDYNNYYNNYNFSVIYDYASQVNAEYIEYYIVCRKSLMNKVMHPPTAKIVSEWKGWLTQSLPLPVGDTTTATDDSTTAPTAVAAASTTTATTTTIDDGTTGGVAAGKRAYRTLNVGKLIYDDEPAYKK